MTKRLHLMQTWVPELDLVADPDRDPATGLPSSLVQARRALTDRELGACRCAWGRHRSPPPTLRRVRVSGRRSAYADPGPARTENDWRLQQATAQLRRVTATELVRFALKDDSDGGRAMKELWESDQLRELLSRYVDAERSSGSPVAGAQRLSAARRSVPPRRALPAVARRRRRPSGRERRLGRRCPPADSRHRWQQPAGR